MRNPDDRLLLLHGPYRPPRCRLGSRLDCEVRGVVKVTRISSARIPWPMTNGRKKRGGRPALIVTGGLVKAIRLESALAIQYWFGLSGTAVWKLRRALDVPRFNAGTKRLYREHVAPNLIAAHTGKPLSIKTRRTLSAIRRKLKMRPPRAARSWTWREDRLLGTMPDKIVAKRTGRTISAVTTRRQLLRIPNATGKGRRMLRVTALMRKTCELRGTM